MNRIVHLVFVATVSLCSSFALAGDLSVAEIQQLITQKQSEFDNFNNNLEAETSRAVSLERDLEALRQTAVQAEVKRQTTLVEMNSQYERVIDDPDLDISPTIQAYAKAVRAHKSAKDAITSEYNVWQTKLQDVEQLRLSKHSLLNTIEGLKERENGARVDRLYKEFNRQNEVEVSHNVVCDRDETISKCMQRGRDLAKQKASKRFLDGLYADLSEPVNAQARRQASDAYVQVLRSEVSDSNFSGQGNFNLTMKLQLQGNLKRAEGCVLLDLDKRYCVNNGAEESAQAAVVSNSNAKVSDKSMMFELTVRSNVYDDEVFVDGVSYGSTKLEIMLPAGEHDVEIVKRGYEPQRQTINLTESHVLMVELQRAQYSFSKGERIQDMLAGGLQGPDLIVVPAGSFRKGDISGAGLDNERPVEANSIASSFGFGETEVSVASFQAFVEATSYVTDAEKVKGCAYYQDGAAIWEGQRNWRSPGFTQTEDHPVVCVSLRDAQAYVDWLSKASTQDYKLPSEVQWEYAARGGKETDYWWGDGVGTDKANCGWCGSQWSNESSAPVASFERNAFGLFDTVGNVWEWTINNEVQGGAVVRGGAWNFAPRLARASTRMELDSNFRSNYIGFRVVREQ